MTEAEEMTELQSLDDAVPFLGHYIVWRQHDSLWEPTHWNTYRGYLERVKQPYRGLGMGYPIVREIINNVHSMSAIAEGKITKGNRMQVRLASQNEIASMELSYGRKPLGEEAA